MIEASVHVRGLSPAWCRTRQQRLVERLQREQIDQALIANRRHVYYLSGYWSASYHTPLLSLAHDGRSHLVVPGEVDASRVAAESITVYESHHLGTLVENQLEAALKPLTADLRSRRSIGTDLPILAPIIDTAVRDVLPIFLDLRRAKDEDELALIRNAVEACEAAYAHATTIVRPGIREIDVFAEMQATAVKALGEPIGELGNDFQAGTPGGPPRRRPIEVGELMPLDVSVSVRGYRCDLCRTLAVGGEPTPQQREAAQLVEEAIALVEQNAHLGSSCAQMYDDVRRKIDGRHGWRFFHHLGHGIGLSPHEAPRLNPRWNDALAVGDVFTVEPGLYDDVLRGGVRIEQNYWMSPHGLQRLSNYPTSL